MQKLLKRTFFTVIYLFVFFTISFAEKIDSTGITIIVSGETHAMLTPCDCPLEPGGGLAERATVLNKYGDTASRLLLDAGGFGGGGIYDNYTGGRVVDSLRTLATVRAMSAMKYDAAAIGDDDLIYGATWLAGNAKKAGLPLVSANCFMPEKKTPAPAYVIVVKNGIRFGITSVVTQERLFTPGSGDSVTGPLGSLKEIWRTMVTGSDYQIIISHLGEEMAPLLIDSFPGCDILVNGHRKTSSAPVSHIGKTLVMQALGARKPVVPPG